MREEAIAHARKAHELLDLVQSCEAKMLERQQNPVARLHDDAFGGTSHDFNQNQEWAKPSIASTTAIGVLIGSAMTLLGTLAGYIFGRSAEQSPPPATKP